MSIGPADAVGAGDTKYDCSAQIDSMDTDYDTRLLIGGRTNDAVMVKGIANLNCLGAYAGSVTLFTGGTKTWGKYFLGINDNWNPITGI